MKFAPYLHIIIFVLSVPFVWNHHRFLGDFRLKVIRICGNNQTDYKYVLGTVFLRLKLSQEGGNWENIVDYSPHATSSAIFLFGCVQNFARKGHVVLLFQFSRAIAGALRTTGHRAKWFYGFGGFGGCRRGVSRVLLKRSTPSHTLASSINSTTWGVGGMHRRIHMCNF